MGSMWADVDLDLMNDFVRTHIRVRQPDGSYAFKKLGPIEAQIKAIPPRQVPEPVVPNSGGSIAGD